MNEVNTTTILEAYSRVKDTIVKTPLILSERLSQKYSCEIYIKREDLQYTRSYKLRGAYNLISSLTDEQRQRGVVCASAGNHAQGFAFSCQKLHIKGQVFMPDITPRQKINSVKKFGGEWITINLIGSNFDEANAKAQEYCQKNDNVFVHPFDDARTISGQGTVGIEIMDELPDTDIIVAPIGGGGLLSGISTYVSCYKKNIQFIGVEPLGAPKMSAAIKNKGPVTLQTIDSFVDGAAVKRAGNLTYQIISENVSDILIAPEGKICTTMIELYQNEGIICEPAGALSLSILDTISQQIKGKKVVCILSGGNNDISRYPEIIEKSIIYEGLKHYFIIEFAQNPGQLRKFVDLALGPHDDITLFEYVKKTNKNRGPALVGIELGQKEDYELLLNRMKEAEISFREITNDPLLYTFLI